MKNRRAGFTLVELVVVIAILAILAGVGSAAYSGYITAANKGVDRETVGNLIYAATLADYADPGLFADGSSAMIVLSEDGTRAAGTSDASKFAAALSDAVDDLGSVKLKYGKWSGAVDGKTLNSMVQSLQTIGYTGADGNIIVTDAEGNPLTASYAASADEMWDMVTVVAKGLEAGGTVTNAAGYLAKAADYTTQTESIDSGSEMGNVWCSVSLSDAIAGAAGDTITSVASAATMAAGMARNHAFAEYLRVNYSELDSAVVEQIRSTANDQVEHFYVSESPATGELAIYAENWATLHGAAQAYVSGGANSQAYADGMIYYALMYNIDEKTKDGTFDVNSDSYFDDIGSYVSVAGKAFSGTVDWNSMVALADDLGSSNAGSSVVIYVTKDGGNLIFDVEPDDANPRDEAVGGGGSAEPTTATPKTGASCSISGNKISISTDTNGKVVFQYDSANPYTWYYLGLGNPGGVDFSTATITLVDASGNPSSNFKAYYYARSGGTLRVSVDNTKFSNSTKDSHHEALTLKVTASDGTEYTSDPVDFWFIP